MKYADLEEMEKRLGKDNVEWIIERFPGQKLPSKKTGYQLKRRDFKHRPGDMTLREFARQKGIALSTAYNWLNK